MHQLAVTIYDYLEKIAKIAPSFVFFIAFLALAIAWRQSREASRSRRLTATKLLLDEIGNVDVRAARTYVMGSMPRFALEDIRENRVDFGGDAFQYARRVGVAYDRIGIMIKQGLVDEGILFDSQHVEIREIWQKIEPMVCFIRTDHYRENYLCHFEYLATNWLPKMHRKRRRRM